MYNTATIQWKWPLDALHLNKASDYRTNGLYRTPNSNPNCNPRPLFVHYPGSPLPKVRYSWLVQQSVSPLLRCTIKTVTALDWITDVGMANAHFVTTGKIKAIKPQGQGLDPCNLKLFIFQGSETHGQRLDPKAKDLTFKAKDLTPRPRTWHTRPRTWPQGQGQGPDL